MVNLPLSTGSAGATWARTELTAPSRTSAEAKNGTTFRIFFVLALLITQRFRGMQFRRTVGRQITEQQSRRAGYKKRQHHRDRRDRNVYSRRRRDQPQHDIQNYRHGHSDGDSGQRPGAADQERFGQKM